MQGYPNELDANSLFLDRITDRKRNRLTGALIVVLSGFFSVQFPAEQKQDHNCEPPKLDSIGGKAERNCVALNPPRLVRIVKISWLVLHSGRPRTWEIPLEATPVCKNAGS
jgi:hypothetical protein